MKELELSAIADLEQFYIYYINKGIDLSLKEKAQLIESKYLNASPLISEIVKKALCSLTDFYASTGIECISKEKAKGLLDELTKQKRIL